ncbi:MAG: hypothetical protein K2X55_28145 [Burkholderiaceae bacterium]|nr:hypothetical protein [Burkholderiaceae bacterium]
MIGDDLSPFFVAGEFSEADDTLNGLPIIGIFDAAYEVSGGGMGMSNTHPAYTTATASLPVEIIDTILATNGKDYRVVNHEPDGTGCSVLILEAA